jgi:hypothetical protein
MIQAMGAMPDPGSGPAQNNPVVAPPPDSSITVAPHIH